MNFFSSIVVLVFVAVLTCGPISSKETKNKVIAKANHIIGQSKEAMKQIQVDIQKLEKLVANLQNASAGTTVYMLEKEIMAIEQQISNKLKSTSSTSNEEFYDNGHQKEVLAYRAKSLIDRANKAINQLKSQSKQDEIKILEQEESKVRTLAVQLEQAKTSEDLAKIEAQLRAAEITILRELQRLHLDHLLMRRDLKTNLIVHGQALLEMAKVSLKKLSKINNSREIHFIKREQAIIEKSINQLASTSDLEQVLQVERKLRISELKMSYYLKRSTHDKVPQSHRNLLRQILEQRAANLNGIAKDAIAVLRVDKKQKDVTTVEADNQMVKNLIKQIKKVTTGTNLIAIEHKLTMAENKLSHELSKAMHLPTKN